MHIHQTLFLLLSQKFKIIQLMSSRKCYLHRFSAPNKKSTCWKEDKENRKDKEENSALTVKKPTHKVVTMLLLPP